MADYVRIRDGRIVEGPGPCPKAVSGISGFHLLSQQEQRAHGWYPFEAGTEPEADPRTHKVVWHLDVGQIVRSYATVEPLSDTEVAANLESLRQELLARNADLRWQMETGGIDVTGIPIHTDRDSQITIFAAALRGGDERWKGRDGRWYSVTGAQLAQWADAIAEHKRWCFEQEEAIANEIRAKETLGELNALDLEALWTLE